MSHEEARKIVIEEAGRHGRDREISFAAAYTPLGPNESYDRKGYGREVEKAPKNGFEYFITAFSMDAAPWEIDASSLSKVGESYPGLFEGFRKKLRSFVQRLGR